MIDLNWNGRVTSFEAVQNSESLVYEAELQAPVVLDTATSYQFSFDVELNGSQNLQFLPLAKQASVELSSNWPSPSFSGRLLPTQREVTARGFTALWKTNNLNMNVPFSWIDHAVHWGDRNVFQKSFGVEIFFATSAYQATERSVKYGLLFIALSFLTFFLFEVFNRSRLHPIQYLLVGFALCLFYTLLLSLSEHLHFGAAYLIASAGTVGLVTGYSASILKHRRQALILGGTLGGLYTYLYTLLQMEDYALLMGSIGLFAILAVVMLITRKLDWYTIGKKPVEPVTDIK